MKDERHDNKSNDRDEELRQILRDLEEKHGHVPKRIVARDKELPKVSEITRRLTDDRLWTSALLEAGVELTPHQRRRYEDADGWGKDRGTGVAEVCESGTSLDEILADGGGE